MSSSTLPRNTPHIPHSTGQFPQLAFSAIHSFIPPLRPPTPIPGTGTLSSTHSACPCQEPLMFHLCLGQWLGSCWEWVVIGRFDCLTQYPHSTLDWTAWHTSCCLCSLEFTPHWVSRLTVPPPPLPVYFFLPTLALLRPSVPVQKAGGEPDQVTTKLGAKLAPIWSAGFLRENWFLDLFFCFFHG